MIDMKGVLVDTDILIDISRDKQQAIDFFDSLSRINQPVFVSVISAMELLVGARNKNEIKEIENFLDDYNFCNLTDDISQKAYSLFIDIK